MALTQAEKSARYNASPKGKARDARYRGTAKAKAKDARYRGTAKAKAKQARYEQTPAGRETALRYRSKHPERGFGRLSARRDHVRSDLRRALDEIKIARGCEALRDTGEICAYREYAIALDFDHRDPAVKAGNVSRMVNAGASWELILAEIAKCDVLCSNCHRVRTHRERHTRRRRPVGDESGLLLTLF